MPCHSALTATNDRSVREERACFRRTARQPSCLPSRERDGGFGTRDRAVQLTPGTFGRRG